MARQKSFARHVAEVSADEIERLKAALAATHSASLASSEQRVRDAIDDRDHWRAKYEASERALERVVNAFDRADSNRGCFSCVAAHDNRCPKSRADSPEKWRGEWRCECGREELDTAIEAARALASPGSPQKRVK